MDKKQIYIFFFVKSLHRKRTEKNRENTLDKKQIYRFFFREIIAFETLKQKGTEKIRDEYNPRSHHRS